MSASLFPRRWFAAAPASVLPALGRGGAAVLLRAAPVVGLLLLWAFASDAFDSPVLFPTPWTTWQKALLLINEGQLQTDAAISMARILTGFVIGSLLGVVLGLLVGTSNWAADLLGPHIATLRFISPTALISIVMIWFGIGELSKVLLIIYTTTFVVLLNTTIGVLNIHPTKMRAAQVFGASPVQRFLLVTLPAALPYVLTGARLAMMNSFMTVVAAEMVAAQSGLGFLIFSSRQWMETDAIFVGMIALGLLGLLTDRALVLAYRLCFHRFQPVV
ncbi:ABC transporter permease [Belnapia rosea]|uniref:ABC transporter permease n=1 Tax=Belnapia rosea TaxID=938405 RepID=UPI00088F4285|nr:ABC transporter permease [Belnapia rosea]SDB74399.1 NitT/TauT family transport system permease protein [Belnapia rosea]